MHKNLDKNFLNPHQNFIKKKIKLVCVVFLFNHPNKVLLQHRDNNKNINHPNIWGPPGGHCDINEKPFDCAMRELKEETGYTLNNINYHSTSSYTIDNQEPHIIMNFWSIYDNKQEINCFEGQEMKFINIHNLDQIKIFSYNQNLIKKIHKEIILKSNEK